jgi:transposase
MAGKSPVTATDEQREALRALAASSDRAEADRARSILLTLSGWTSERIAQAFGVREDTVRLWRSEFIKSGVEGLKTHISPGPEPVKAQAALKVAEVLLAEPVANRTNWTLPRLITEIEQREGVRISKSRLSVVLRQKGGSVSAGRGTR